MARDRLAGHTGAPQYELSLTNYGNTPGDQMGLLDDAFYTEVRLRYLLYTLQKSLTKDTA